MILSFALDFRNTPSTTNLEGEEREDAPGKDGNASMPEQVIRPNPWRKMTTMIMIHFKVLSTTGYHKFVHVFNVTQQA
jgi:hypothetical protein